jgi:hypothetical protein
VDYRRDNQSSRRLELEITRPQGAKDQLKKPKEATEFEGIHCRCQQAIPLRLPRIQRVLKSRQALRNLS